MKLCLGVFVGFVASLSFVRPTWACQSDADCKGDRVCEAERCVAPKPAATGCRQDTDCRGNDVCEQSVCVAPPPPPGVVAAVVPAPAPPPAAPVPAPAEGPAAASMPAPVQATPTPAAPAGAPAAAPTPTAAPTPAATAKSTAAPNAEAAETFYKSIAVLIPNVEDHLGISGHMEQKISSWSSLVWAPTIGFLYEGLFYTGGGDVTAYTQTAGLTMGIRPAINMFLSFALRAGVMVTLDHVEAAGQTSNHFDGALMAGGDLMIGYVVIGAEVWKHDSSIWMGRAGFAW
jgi:hypothetical protein